MVDEPLLSEGDLGGFPGAPYTAQQATAAAAGVRTLCGWHIAPQVSETVVLDSDGGPLLLLPTLKLVEVAEVRDLTGDEPRAIEGWRSSSAGMLYRRGGWPRGFGAVEVTMTHGHEVCPPELVPEVAARAQAAKRDQSVSQETLGSRSVSLRERAVASPVLERHMLPPRP
jgi:hypothetical protein